MSGDMVLMAESHMERTRGQSSHHHVLQKATLCLRVKVIFYCHATKCMKLALIGRNREQTVGRDRGQKMLLHIQQGFNQQWKILPILKMQTKFKMLT